MAEDARPEPSIRTDRDADVDEERDRYRELLEEFRTIIPGVQVLFAFLLTAPFSGRFTELDAVGRALFVVSLVTAALSIVAFLTPAAYHRLTRRSLRRDRLQVAIVMALVGLVLVATSIITVAVVVIRFIYSTTWGLAIGGGLAAAFLSAWYVLPLFRRGIAVDEA